MRRNLFLSLLFAALSVSVSAKTVVFNVKPVNGDATKLIRSAIDKARKLGGSSQAVIRFQAGAVYNLSRTEATPVLYHVSNTTSVEENPDPVKHIGILLKDMENIVIDGQGATIITHGEMTPWVIDGCRDVTIANLTVTAADPSVPEMTVTATDSLSFTAKVHPTSRYNISNGKLYWQGEGWEFTDGIAQVYYPETGVTLRCGSPVADAIYVEELSPGVLKFNYGRRPSAEPGQTFQMRHSLRTEVAGLINGSERIKLTNLNLNFMGNFGIVAQTSTNITYNDLTCAPAEGSGRTCAGFADFLQVSGCRGLVDIRGCHFSGSHDDPINVHGTHLKVTDWGDGRKLRVRYMHPQTFGFQSFFNGDTIEVVDPRTLLPVATARINAAGIVDDYTLELLLDRTLTAQVQAVDGAVIENISWTPEVRITDCHFSATPTRGILVTTRRPVLIADNYFERIPMASILIADDGRSWYESGPVSDVTIRNNRFVDCSLPVIQVAPEISVYDGPVHRNVRVTGNQFEYTKARRTPLIEVRATDGVTVTGNKLTSPSYMPQSVTLEDCLHVTVEQ